MTPVAGAGGKRSPLGRHPLTRLPLAEGQLGRLRPVRGLELLHPHPLLQARLRVPAWGSARWRWDPVPLLTNCCQAPKHPGEQRERAGANHKDCSYGHLPRAGHMTGAATSPLWGSASSSVK